MELSKDELLKMHVLGYLNEKGYFHLVEKFWHGEPEDFKSRREKALTEKATDVNP